MFKKRGKLISLKEAAKISGYASDYIGYLIRTGEIKGRKTYGNSAWFVNIEDLLAYKKKRHCENSSRNYYKEGGQEKKRNLIYDIFPPIRRKVSSWVKAFRLFLKTSKYAAVFVFFGIVICGALIVSAIPPEGPEILTTKFYPVLCEGGWENPQNAQGRPDLSEGAVNEEFNEENSAILRNSVSQIFCQNFKGKVPFDSEIKKVSLKFSWAFKKETPEFIIPAPTPIPSEENFTPEEISPEQKERENGNSEPIIEPESSPEISPPPAPENNEESLPQSPSTWKRIINPVFAQSEESEVGLPIDSQESISPTDEPDVNEEAEVQPAPNQSTGVGSLEAEEEEVEEELAPQEEEKIIENIINDAFLEIFYTLDEENQEREEISHEPNWQSLGKVNQNNWQNLVLEVPISDWEDLKKIQISIQSLMTINDQPTVYLDSLWLEIEYEGLAEDGELTAEEIEKLPRIEVEKEKVFKLSKRNFQANEEPEFEIDVVSLEEEYLKIESAATEEELLEIPDDNLTPIEEDLPEQEDVLAEPETEIIEGQELNPAIEEYTEPEPELEPEFQNQTENNQNTNQNTEQNTEEEIPPESSSFLETIFKFFGDKKVLAKTPEVEILNTSVFNVQREKVNLSPIIEEIDGKTKIRILEPEENFKPGKYEIEIEILIGNKVFVSNQDFSWGVLVINVNKSVYLPNEAAFLQIAVLNDGGHTVCNASLKLEITNPKGETETLTTENGTIHYSDTCGPDNVTDNPDYFAYYRVGEPGEYQMKLTNLDNGYEIEDSFEVREEVLFEVERVGATRINPFKASYVMTFKIKANRDFEGEIKEKVPQSFEINSPTSWQVNLKAGEEIELKYEYRAPEISPKIYFLGPLEFLTDQNLFLKLIGPDEKIIFKEARQWQIASDAPSTVVDSDQTGATARPGQRKVVRTTNGTNGNRTFVVALSAATTFTLYYSDDTEASSPTWTSVGNLNTSYYASADMVWDETNNVLYIVYGLETAADADTSDIKYRRVTGLNTTPALGTERDALSASATLNYTHPLVEIAGDSGTNKVFVFATGRTDTGNPARISLRTGTLNSDNPTWDTLYDVKSWTATANSGNMALTRSSTGRLILFYHDNANMVATLHNDSDDAQATSGWDALDGTDNSQTTISADDPAAGLLASAVGTSASNVIWFAWLDSASDINTRRWNATSLDTELTPVALDNNAVGPVLTTDDVDLWMVYQKSTDATIMVYQSRLVSNGTSAWSGTETTLEDHSETVRWPSVAKRLYQGKLDVVYTTLTTHLVRHMTSYKISGNVYQSSASSPYEGTTKWSSCDGSTKNLGLSVAGGTKVNTWCSSSDGSFYFVLPQPSAANSDITLFLDTAGGNKGALFTHNADTVSDITGLTLFKDRVWIQSESATSITNADINTYDQSNDSDIPVASDGSTVTVDNDIELHINSGDTYAPGGDVNTPKLHIKGTYTGASETLLFNAGGTSSSCDDTVANLRPLCIDGGTFTPSSNTTSFSGLTASTIEATTYNNLTLQPLLIADITYTGGGDITVNGNLDLNPQGITTIQTLTFNLGGTTTVSGSITIRGTTILIASANSLLNTTNSNHSLTGGSVTVNSDSTLTANGSTVSLTGTGDVFTISGTFNKNTSTVEYKGVNSQNISANNYHHLTSSSIGGRVLASSGTIGIAGTFTPGTNSYTVTGSTIDFNGTSNQTINAGFTYNNLQARPTANNITDTFAAGTATIQGNFTAGNGTNTGIVVTAATNSTILSITGNFTISANTTFTAHASNSFSIGGNWSNSGTFTHSSGTVTFNKSSSTQTLDSGGITAGKIFYNLEHTGAGTLQLSNNGLNVDGDFSQTAGIFDANSQNQNFAGAFSLSSGTTYTKGGTLTFDGSSQTLTDSTTAPGQDLGTVTIGPSTTTSVATVNKIRVTTLTIGADDTLNITDDTLTIAGTGTPFTITAGGTFTTTNSTVVYTGTTTTTNITTTAYNNLTLTPTAATTYNLTDHLTSSNALTGDLTINTNATLDTTASNYNITLADDWSNSGVFTANSNTVTLNGSGNQALSGTMTGGSAFYNLDITNSSGSVSGCSTSFTPGVQFDASATISNNYTIATTSLSAGVYVQYNSASTYTITNISWVGTATKQIYFRNSNLSSGTWLLNVSGTQSVSYVDVARSDASGGTEIDADDGTNTNCNNNTNWNFAQPSISFSISANSLSLGNLNPFSVFSNNHTTTISTNASSGYVLYISEDGNLRKGSDDINDVTDGSVTTGSEEYGLNTGYGDFTSDSAITSSVKKARETNSAVTDEETTYTYRAGVSTLTVLGNYSHIVTIVVTGKF